MFLGIIETWRGEGLAYILNKRFRKSLLQNFAKQKHSSTFASQNYKSR